VVVIAGVGPRPKNSDQLVGHGAAKGRDAVLRVIPVRPTSQPDLPDFEIIVQVDGYPERRRFEWPGQTRIWWQMWADSPLSSEFTETDWSELLDTALLHARFWNGDHKVAAELRLRVAKFGATPEDRARLRIQFATADKVESDRVTPVPSHAPGGQRRRLVGE
jgi:hypothetical protein